MAREALAENEEKLARLFQEAEAMEAKMVQKLQDLEVKLQESQEPVGILVVVFAFVYWCVMNYPN
jgi:rubrerythrin